MADYNDTLVSAFDNVTALDKQKVLDWYLLSKDRSQNPGRIIDLDEHGKICFKLINSTLISGGYELDYINNIIDNLKKYYNSLDSVSQKHELVLIDLMIETYKLTAENDSAVFEPEINFKELLPKFEAHFTTEKLEMLDFKIMFSASDGYIPLNFLCRFRQTITKDVIEKLDKAFEIDSHKSSSNSLFAYQSELEYCYIDLLIKMIISTYDSPYHLEILVSIIGNWLNKYPFRTLNSKGVSTPDNFFVSFNNYVLKITEETYGNDENEKNKKIINYYYAFLNKLKIVRSPVQINIETHHDFFDKYDSSKKYEQNGIEPIDVSIRSIYFREDFDYLNSLLIRGINLNRKFWIIIDKAVESFADKKLGTYLQLLANAKGLDEFYKTITFDLNLENNDFLLKMLERLEMNKKICDIPKDYKDDNLIVVPYGGLIEEDVEMEEPMVNKQKINPFQDISGIFPQGEYKKYVLNGIHFIDRDIYVTDETNRYVMKSYEKSSKTKIINENNKSITICAPKDRCNILNFREMLFNLETDSSGFIYPIHRISYERNNLGSFAELMKLVNLKKCKIYRIGFYSQNKLKGAKHIVDFFYNFDVVNAENSSIINFVNTLTSKKGFIAISVDYVKIPDPKNIDKPVFRKDDFKERMLELQKSIDRLIEVTLVEYRMKYEKAQAEGEIEIAAAETKVLDAQAEEINANNTRRTEIAKIKEDGAKELERIKQANKAKEKAAKDALAAAEAELQKAKDEMERKKREREEELRKAKEEYERKRKIQEAEIAALKEKQKIVDSQKLLGDEIKVLRKEIGIIKSGFNGSGLNGSFDKNIKNFNDSYEEINKYKPGSLTDEKASIEALIQQRDVLYGTTGPAFDLIKVKQDALTAAEGVTPQVPADINAALADFTSTLLAAKTVYEQLKAFYVTKETEIDTLNTKAEGILTAPNVAAKKKASNDAALAAKQAEKDAKKKEKAAAEAAAKAAEEAERKRLADEKKAREDEAKRLKAEAEEAKRLADEAKKPKPVVDPAAPVPPPVVASTYPKYVEDWIRTPKRDERGKPAPDGYVLVDGKYYKTPEVVVPKDSKPADENNWTLVGDYYYKKFSYDGVEIMPSGYKCVKVRGGVKGGECAKTK